MTKLMFVMPLLAISIAHADEWKTVSVPKPIKVNKSSEYPDPAVSQNSYEMNLKLRDKGNRFLVNTNAEVLKNGKIYSVNDLTAIADLDEVAAIVNSDHCEIYDAFDLYKPGMKLKGNLQLHVYNTTPLNVMTYASETGAGMSAVTQILQQEYFVVQASNRNSLLAMIRCFTTLQSNSGDEAVEKEKAYEAAGVYAPLIKQLSE